MQAFVSYWSFCCLSSTGMLKDDSQVCMICQNVNDTLTHRPITFPASACGHGVIMTSNGYSTAPRAHILLYPILATPLMENSKPEL